MKKTQVVAATITQSEQVGITVPPLEIREFDIVLIGDSSLISHKWSEKAKGMIEAKQQKAAKQQKEARNPDEEYRNSLYEHPEGGYGFPAVAFKSAAVDACLAVDGVKKTEARAAFHIIGDLVKIDGQPTRRDDMGRIGMGISTPIYRGEFKNWKATLRLRYNARALSPAQIVNLFNTAGFGIGVGEWRPQKDGSKGMFHVETQRDLQ